MATTQRDLKVRDLISYLRRLDPEMPVYAMDPDPDRPWAVLEEQLRVTSASKEVRSIAWGSKEDRDILVIGSDR